MDTLAIIKRIEMRLCEIGMSKAEFYKMTGISSASFSQWRTGTYNPTEKKLSSAAICLGVSLNYLVNGKTAKDELDITTAMRSRVLTPPTEAEWSRFVLLALINYHDRMIVCDERDFFNKGLLYALALVEKEIEKKGCVGDQ